MPIQHIIQKINRHLISTFAVLDSWFDQPDELLKRKFSDDWCPSEILEHVMLTNHYLLLLIEKASVKARNKAAGIDFTEQLAQYHFDDVTLNQVASPASFVWSHPKHMTPTGSVCMIQVRAALREQLYRCLFQLDVLERGEGILCKTTMSVHDLGKLDVYQYLYFLSLHGERHCKQLEKHAYVNQLAAAHCY